MKRILILLIVALGIGFGCEEQVLPPDPNQSGGDGDGDGDVDGDGDADIAPGQQTGDDDCQSVLEGVLRDFPETHEDFHYSGGNHAIQGMVQSTLDSEDKPVRGDEDFHSANLDEWYRTIDGVNQVFTHRIALHEDETNPGTWTFTDSEFFPLDGKGYGADDPDHPDHNYFFTTELVMDFVYEEGQVFGFEGDDDLWVFIDRKLALDIGGIHVSVKDEVDIDEFAADHGLEPGNTYPMHIFHAERNPVDSHFTITTSIACFKPVVVK